MVNFCNAALEEVRKAAYRFSYEDATVCLNISDSLSKSYIEEDNEGI